MTSHPRATRFWIATGSPRAIRLVYIVIVLYALIIGSLMYGYANVQSCFADYADANALVLQVRAKTSTDDRILQQRVDAVNAADRQATIATQASLAGLVQTAARGNRSDTRTALLDFAKVNEQSLQTYASDERERTSIAQERARIDAIRAATPIPGPPSEQC
jgi:multidrug efflux pump subunit AcrB